MPNDYHAGCKRVYKVRMIMGQWWVLLYEGSEQVEAWGPMPWSDVLERSVTAESQGYDKEM